MQQSIGGHYLEDMSSLGLRLKRTKGSKLPRCIPVLHRERIRNGDLSVIRFWLTLFSIYRILDFKGTLKTHTITDPSEMKDPLLVESFKAFMTNSFIRSLQVYSRDTKLMAAFNAGTLMIENMRATPFLISKSTPTVKGRGKKEEYISPLSTSPLGLVSAASA
jgi:hypothetical protein